MRELRAADAAVGHDDAQAIEEQTWSVVASEWVTACAPHLGALIAVDTPADADTHEVSLTERAHSIAAATMLVFALECLAGRVAARGWRGRAAKPNEQAESVLVRALGESREAADSVKELFVLRDSLVHGHVWERTLVRGTPWDQPARLVTSIDLRGRFDKKYSAVAVDMDGTMRSRSLCLHLVPTEVRRWDVVQVLRVAVTAFDALAAGDTPNMPSLSDTRLQVDSGRLTTLRELLPRLES